MKARQKKNDLLAIALLMLLSSAVMLSLVLKGTVYGSTEDWASQHYAIPEYFRMRFYDTHQLFPSYAPNIGAGENIYALSYYGLYSPLILLSYLLPFVPMGIYVMCMGAAAVLFSQAAFYLLLRKRYDIRLSLMTSLFFTFSLPLILHSHRHVMFVTFLPFLLLAMHAADRFFRCGKSVLLPVWTCCMILCNYFFAPAALLALAAYGAYLVLEEQQTGGIRAFFRRYLPFLLRVLLGVLLSAVLLLPTAYTLLSGRDKTNSTFSLRDLLPSLRYDWLTYFGYTMGLSAFGVFAAVYFLFRGNRGKRFLAGLVLLFAVFPFTIYLLNGMQYTDSKVLFPFLPAALLLTAELLKTVFEGKFTGFWLPFTVFAVSVPVSLVLCGSNPPVWGFVTDAAVVLTVFLSTVKRKDILKPCAWMLLTIPIAVCVIGNHVDPLQDRETYDIVNAKTVSELTEQASEGRMVRTAVDTNRLNTVNKVYAPSHYLDTIYSSVHSKDYNNFFFNEIYNENQFRNAALTTRSRNVLFNTYMGNRFYISNEPVQFFGYSLKQTTSDGYYLYENPSAFPMLYTTDRVMSRRQYHTLSYPDNIEALMRYRIVERELPDTAFTPSAVRTEINDIFDPAQFLHEDERSAKKDGVRRFVLNDGYRSYSCDIPEAFKGKIVLLRVYVNNPTVASAPNQIGFERAGDVRIKINGVKNTLTDPEWKYYNNNHWFEFVLSDGSTHLEIELWGKRFEISQLAAYTLEPDILAESAAELQPFSPDLQETRGDVIAGSITAEHDTWFSTSLVYHEGFSVTVDGNPVTPERTDLVFLGFPLSAGTHQIRITFTAPLLHAGMIASGIGCLLLLLLAILEHRQNKRSG